MNKVSPKAARYFRRPFFPDSGVPNRRLARSEPEDNEE